MNVDRFLKKLISNTVFIFVIIIIIIIIATYLSFKKIETYKFLVVINIISSIIIFILLSLNDHYKSSSGYELLPMETHGGGIDDDKIKYFNNIFDNTTGGANILPVITNTNVETELNTTGEIIDDVDQQIENIIRELK